MTLVIFDNEFILPAKEIGASLQLFTTRILSSGTASNTVSLFMLITVCYFAIYFPNQANCSLVLTEITFVFQVQNSERICSSPWCAIACLCWFIVLDYFVPGYVAACSSSFLKAAV